MGLNCIKCQTVWAEELTKEALSCPNVQYGRPAEAADYLGDLLMAAVWVSVKGVVLDVAASGFARRSAQ